MSDTKERAALGAATISAYFMGGEIPASMAKVRDDLLLISQRAEPEPRDGDPRVDPLGSSAILTDTRIRLTFAPERPEARVVALEKEVRCTQVQQLASMMQLGRVHVQIKDGFGAERSIVLKPAEMVMIYDLMDRFIAELPRVDNKTSK